MVYNGEVYNFKEIQKEIKKQKPEFHPRTTSDSEIILEAFALWNADFVERLNGMFAIAIWDILEKRLFLFRDRIGIKPLFYFQKNGLFAFSSELKALMACNEIRKHLSLHYTAINQFLHLGYIPNPDTIYQEIKKFPAGHYGVWDTNGFSMKPYWNPEEKILKPQLKNSDQALEELQQLVESSVAYRLISDVPYGTFLSGGIDSSLVTAVAQKMNREPINTFSIGFWEKEYNEAPYARKIAEQLGTRHHEFTVTEEDALRWIPRLNEIYDEPFADSSAIPTLLVSQMAKQNVTMTLSGDGGDELFMGYGSYIWARRLSAAHIPAIRTSAAMILNLGSDRSKRAAGLFENPGKSNLRSHIFSQEQYLFSRKEIQKLLKSQYLRNFDLNENFRRTDRYLKPEEEQALFDLKYYLPDDLLVKVDRASMHFALETRVPLLDYRIVEWALNLHPSLKIKNGNAKWILKKLLYKYLPAELFDRPKRGFSVPLGKWLRNDLKDYTMDYLNPQALKNMGLIEEKQAESLLKNFYEKDRKYLYNKVWHMLVVHKWLSDYNDGTY